MTLETWMQNFLADEKSRILLVSGFSGAGKGSAMKQIRHIWTGDLAVHFPRSVTTRKPRAGNEAEFYRFWTPHEVLGALNSGYFLEYTYGGDYFYGTPKEELWPGCCNVLEVDVLGKWQLEGIFPAERLTTVFLTTRTAEELVSRLRKRGTEPDAQITGRLKRALDQELDRVQTYDYIFVNDDLNETVDRLSCLLAGSDAVSSDCYDAERFRSDLSQIVERLYATDETTPQVEPI